MTATAAPAGLGSIPFRAAPGAPVRLACLGVGAAASMLSVGGRWDIALAAWIAPIFLLRFLRDTRPWAGLLSVWLLSIAACTWWGVQLGVPLQLAWVIASVSGTFLTIPYVFDRLLTPRLGVLGKLLVFPAAYATVEWLMGTFSPLGTSSGLRAITQTDHLALLQLMAVAGPYSIGFLINWLATTVNLVWEQPRVASVRKVALLYGAVLGLTLLGGGARLAFAPPADAYVRMAGVTPSMRAQEAARAMIEGREPSRAAQVDPAAIMVTTGLLASKEELARTDPAVARAAHALVHDDLIAATREAARAGAKVVVWSETAASLHDEAEKPALLARVAQVAREEGVYVDVAIGQPFARNETHLIGPDGASKWAYDKNRPVPVLEPIAPRPSRPPVVQTPYGRLSNVICFDGDFPALNRVDADIMIIPGFDWPQVGRMHTLKAARLRAIENGYALIRIAYHSQSAAFDRLGNVLATQDTTGPGRHIMYADVPTEGARTLYNRTGDLLGWLSAVLVAAAVLAAALKRRI